MPLPEALKAINPLNPKNYPVTPKMAGHISYAIEVLAKKIDEQITSRDFSLVEQSKDGIIGFQPYWEGGISGGALEEAKYNHTLRGQHGQENRELYVIEKQENLGKRRIEHLFSSLLSHGLKESYLSENVRKKINTLAKQWQGEQHKVSEFIRGTWRVETTRREIEKILPSGYEFNDKFFPVQTASLHGANMYEKQERLKMCWEKLFENTKTHNPFKPYCSNPEMGYFISTSNRFESICNKFINIIKKPYKKGRR